MMDLMYKNNVLELRRKHHLSQEELAKAVGISKSMIRNIEKGSNRTSLENAYRIAAYFQMLVQDVFPPETTGNVHPAENKKEEP